MFPKDQYKHSSQGRLLVVRDVLLSFIALSGYLYYCYKFGSPDLGNNDFYHYKEMVERPLDFNAAPAPWVLRQLPTIVAHQLYELGAFYETKTNFDIILPGAIETKKIFFALILSNALAAGMSFAIALYFIRGKTFKNDSLVSFSYIGLMLSYFYLPFSFIAPLTYGWGWLVSTIFVIGFLEKRSSLILLGCALSLVTRETILVFALPFSISAWASFGRRDQFYLQSACVIAAAGIVVILMRVFVLHGHENEFDVITNITSFWPGREFVLQATISQALIFFLLFSLHQKYRAYSVTLFISMLAVIIVAVGTGITSTGRFIGETLPFYAIIFILSKLESSILVRPDRPVILNANKLFDSSFSP